MVIERRRAKRSAASSSSLGIVSEFRGATLVLEATNQIAHLLAAPIPSGTLLQHMPFAMHRKIQLIHGIRFFNIMEVAPWNVEK